MYPLLQSAITKHILISLCSFQWHLVWESVWALFDLACCNPSPVDSWVRTSWAASLTAKSHLLFNPHLKAIYPAFKSSAPLFHSVCVALSVSPSLSPLTRCLLFLLFVSRSLPQGESYFNWGWSLSPLSPIHLSPKDCSIVLCALLYGSSRQIC